MTDTNNTANKGVEAAEKQLQKAKNRLTQEKKKANEARRRIECVGYLYFTQHTF